MCSLALATVELAPKLCVLFNFIFLLLSNGKSPLGLILKTKSMNGYNKRNLSEIKRQQQGQGKAEQYPETSAC